MPLLTTTHDTHTPPLLEAQRARSESVSGRIIMRCVFASDGSVKYILVTESLPFGLTEAAIAAAKRIKFVPAAINGKPVSTYMQLEYNFAIF